MIPRPSRLVPAICLVGLLAQQAHAEKDIVIEIPGERPLDNKILIGGLVGAGFLSGVIGAYFHLDSRSASSDVSSDRFTGHAWTSEEQDLVDRADRSKTRAIIGYSVGGALLVGAAIVWIATEPKSETAVIHPHGRGTPTAQPTEGGAILGGMWSF